ncbi:MAG: PfkB family carbohydrate kinase, partial [Kiritimatiellae bacterium]|nr:PfkB family carbohydrate kinase [Kiritimatiellia bacterium]
VAARGAELWRAGIFKTRVTDPSGSGDAFDSGIITGMVHGWDLPETLSYAAALGASAVRAVGTTTGVFTTREARSFLKSHRLELRRG